MAEADVVRTDSFSTAPATAGGNRWAVEWGLVAALWRRDMIHLIRQRSRWMGVVMQPLLFWIVIGSGMTGVFQLEGSAAQVDYLEYFFPGIIAMVVLFTAIFATMSVIEDRQNGFLQQVMVVPGSRASFVLGKTAGVTTMALVQCGLCVLAAPMAGLSLGAVHWPMLLAALVLGCVGLTAINFAFAWLIDSTAGYHALMGVILFPLWIVSGAMFPPTGAWVDSVMAANPMTYLVDATRHAMYGGVAPVSHGSAAFALGGLAAVAVLGLCGTVLLVSRRTQGGRA